MIINIDYLENNIMINDNKIICLEIENKNYFYRIVKDFCDIANGVISEQINISDYNNKELNLNGKLMVIIDYFNFDFNSKKILNNLYKTLTECFDEQDKIRISNYYNKIKNIISSSLSDLNVNFPAFNNATAPSDDIYFVISEELLTCGITKFGYPLNILLVDSSKTTSLDSSTPYCSNILLKFGVSISSIF